jgi:hypothetical protein
MLSAARNFWRHIPPSVIYCNFVILLVLATEPTWHSLIVGLTLDDLLKLSCLGAN